MLPSSYLTGLGEMSEVFQLLLANFPFYFSKSYFVKQFLLIRKLYMF